MDLLISIGLCIAQLTLSKSNSTDTSVNDESFISKVTLCIAQLTLSKSNSTDTSVNDESYIIFT